MDEKLSSHSPIRFGAFEVDLRARELRRKGYKVPLQEQPFQVLISLLESPGEVVTREQLRARLWPHDTFVDFEHGLNRAINKVREALGDSAENPRFIETLPKRGYRFLASTSGTQTNERAVAGGQRQSNSLAILPLANVSKDAELDYLCDGITETLIYSAAQLERFRVMAWSTVQRYRSCDTDPQSVGRELNVDAVLAGRVQRRSNDVTVNIEIVDVADGSLLWGEQFSRRMSSVHEVQEEVTHLIVQKLRIKLSAEQISRVTRRHTANAEAYHLYLLGRYQLNKRTVQGFQKAIVYFNKAVEADPAYALAYAGLADTYALTGMSPYSLRPAKEVMPLCESTASEALQLDPALGEAHRSLALVRFLYDWDYAAAEKLFRRAIELSPGSSNLHQRYSIFLFAMGRFKESLAEAQRGRELDPLEPIASILIGVSHYFAREKELAVEQMRKAVHLDPSVPILYVFLGMGEAFAGELDTAIETLQIACKIFADHPVALSRLAYVYGLAGHQNAVREIIARLEKMSDNIFVPPQDYAFAHLGIGDFDRVFECLERGCEDRSDYMVYLNVDPPFDVIRDHSRFISLLRRVNLLESSRSSAVQKRAAGWLQ